MGYLLITPTSGVHVLLSCTLDVAVFQCGVRDDNDSDLTWQL